VTSSGTDGRSVGEIRVQSSGRKNFKVGKDTRTLLLTLLGRQIGLDLHPTMLLIIFLQFN
jgi:hypothetical protein